MKPWALGLLGGLSGAALVVGLLAWRKNRELSARAVAMRDAVQTQGQALETYLLSKGTGIEQELAALSQQAADRTGEYHLATAYGVTPQFAALVNRAAQRFGAS